MKPTVRRSAGKARSFLETRRYAQGVRAQLPVLTVTGARRGPLAVVMACQHGRELHQALKSPVGLIDSSAGGTAVEAWMKRSVLEADPLLKSLVQPDPEFYENFERFEKEWPEYQKAKAEKKPLPPYPKTPFRGYANPASSFYSVMIAPLIPFGIKAWSGTRARRAPGVSSSMSRS